MASRDVEILDLLESGKLRVERGVVMVRHERDGQYRPAKFHNAGSRSPMDRTSICGRAYYQERILAVARQLGKL